MPPEIFGETVRVTLGPARGGSRPRAESTRQKAAASAKAARARERACKRMERERTLQAARRGRRAETRAEVHSYNAKRRMLRPPYDPYVPESAPARRSLWHSLEDEAAKAQRAAREMERAERWAALQRQRREDRAGERATQACKRARQEAYSLLSNPPWLRPMPGVGRTAHTKRKSQGGPSRGAKIARLARE